MPKGAVYVGRGSRWGNPWQVGGPSREPGKTVEKAAEAVECFRVGFWSAHRTPDDARKALRGKPLCCWCAPGAPCHADVLLEVANA